MSKTRLNTISTKAPEEIDKEAYDIKLDALQKEMFALQHKLYASMQYSFLIIFQGIDTSGKDSTIRHVFSCVDPLGVQATSFKAPTDVELLHDYMWRIFQKLPEKGMIQIFNRSYYEDILFPSIQKTLSKKEIEKRYTFINAFEEHLSNNKTIILKFYLHISQNEQKKRILERINDPLKKWKYSKEDLNSSGKWKNYTKVYEEIIDRCSSKTPWIIVPADNKWYRNYVVASVIVKHLKKLNLKYPTKKNKI